MCRIHRSRRSHRHRTSCTQLLSGLWLTRGCTQRASGFGLSAQGFCPQVTGLDYMTSCGGRSRSYHARQAGLPSAGQSSTSGTERLRGAEHLACIAWATDCWSHRTNSLNCRTCMFPAWVNPELCPSPVTLVLTDGRMNGASTEGRKKRRNPGGHASC